ncbi:MAG TPA: amidohydrolase family protein, partial [Terriglobales bacterium]
MDQIYSQLPVVQVLADDVMKARVPVVFDHFAGARPALGPSQTGFDVLVDLVRAGKAWIKLSAAYRISDQSPKYPDAAPLARRLITAN